MKKLFILMIIIAALSGISSCDQADAENPAVGDMSADAWISPTFTIMDVNSGIKNGARIIDRGLDHIRMINLKTWNPQNGDIFFLRGDLISSQDFTVENNNFNWAKAVVPLETEFYWNEVCLYYNGFCYQLTETEDGLRIYNRGLWTLGGYCVIVQAGSSLALPELGINREMLQNIHKIKVRRGHLKVSEMNPNVEGAFTPPGLLWKYYKNQGKEIRSPLAGEYLKAEDFIAKTDAASGYFKSLTSDLQIKRVSIYNDGFVDGIDCSKVY